MTTNFKALFMEKTNLIFLSFINNEITETVSEFAISSKLQYRHIRWIITSCWNLLQFGHVWNQQKVPTTRQKKRIILNWKNVVSVGLLR